MGVLQDFERRLEGAVEGFFARAFRSRLQPIELAKALQRYAEDNRHVTTDGVVVPNEFWFTISPTDDERLATFGDLAAELAQVVTDTADERSWTLRGRPLVHLTSGDVRVGRYELAGRVDASTGPSPTATKRPAPAPAPAPAAAPAPTPAPTPAPPTDEAAASDEPDIGATQVIASAPRVAAVLVAADGATLPLTSGRYTLGRLPECDLHVDDTTVSREHAAVVRRGDRWWLLDLGSTNGTRVNGVQAAEQPITIGDEIELGDALIEIREAG